MDDTLKKILSESQFTTHNIEKNFLPRRVGLGYVVERKNVETEIIGACKRKMHKKKRLMVVEEDEEQEFSKSRLV